MTRRPFALLAIAPLALSLTACADEEEPAPEDVTAAEVAAMTAPVESAIASPNGVVSAETVSGIFEAMSSQEAAQGPLGFIPGAGPGAAPQQTGGTECMDVGATGGTIDMGCMSGGEMTGKVVYAFAGDAQTAFILMDYQSVCMDSFCMDGEAAQKIVTSASGDLQMTLAFDLTVTDGASSYELDYGYQMSVVDGVTVLTYVVWVDGESYAVSFSYDGEGYEATVTGDNGTFTCTASLQDGDYVGSCSGDGEFSF